jgi:hypothetical protein
MYIKQQIEKRFPKTYQQSVSAFRAAATIAGARVETHTLPHLSGPNSELLTVDVAYIGNDNATKVLFMESGRHGVEGRAGSGIQIDSLNALARTGMPDNVRGVYVHAINPYGMAYDTRGNEEGVDLNRNHLPDFRNLPKSSELFTAYPGLMDILVPHDLSAVTIDETRRLIDARWNKAFIDGVMLGQYDDPRGLLYGGTRPSWSFTLWKQLAREILRNAAEVVHLDIHTGIGKPGIPQVILLTDPDSPAHRRAQAIWLSDTHEVGREPVDVKCLGRAVNTSVSAALSGTAPEYWPHLLAELPEGKALPQIVAAGLEIGPKASKDDPAVSIPFREVMEAKRLRQAAFVLGDRDPATPSLVERLREAFCPDDPVWEATALRESRHVIRLALDGLAKA